MKKIEDKYICKYCLGCSAEELEDFRPRMNCLEFVPAYNEWQKKYYGELRGEENGM